MLNEIMKDAMARSAAHYGSDPDRWVGPDWWQLSPEESEVFALRPARWAELVPVWEAFEFFTSRTDGWNDADIERDYPDLDAVIQAAQERHPEWLGPDADETFPRFARHFGGVSHREAHAVLAKMDFWEVRTGVKWYADEEN